MVGCHFARCATSRCRHAPSCSGVSVRVSGMQPSGSVGTQPAVAPRGASSFTSKPIAARMRRLRSTVCGDRPVRCAIPVAPRKQPAGPWSSATCSSQRPLSVHGRSSSGMAFTTRVAENGNGSGLTRRPLARRARRAIRLRWRSCAGPHRSSFRRAPRGVRPLRRSSFLPPRALERPETGHCPRWAVGGHRVARLRRRRVRVVGL